MDIDFNTMIEQKENIETAGQLHEYLRGICGFEEPSKDELDRWGYKNDLFISPKFLIGRALYEIKQINFWELLKTMIWITENLRVVLEWKPKKSIIF